MDNKTQYDVIIIGAGIAGLAAARKCEDRGFSTLIVESDEQLGGRIKTDSYEGFNLDRGFQVLIDSYEKAKDLLNFDLLDLKSFEPGARIYDKSGGFTISDPSRRPSALPKMLFSRVGSVSDKFKMLSLTKKLQSQNTAEVFLGKQQSTMDFLKGYGFSDKIIENFFRPFFGGIFLERELATDAAMFRFVFKNFSNGNACLPSKGMGEIPKQLNDKLKSTEIRFKTKVKQVHQDASVELENGSTLFAKKVIIACDPGLIFPQLAQSVSWHKTTTMYFAGEKNLPSMGKKIGLDARRQSTINNFARHDEVTPSCAPSNKSLWSVTLRNDADANDVKKNLAELLKVRINDLTFLKEYRISHALPRVIRPALTLSPEETSVTAHVHLAGDYLTNASIDGALRSGENAAIAVTEAPELNS
jgi:phytoene dehydrogenase-like protein